MSALMIANITVKDPEKFNQYLTEAKPVGVPYGAKLLYRGKASGSLTGHETDHSVVVIVQFPHVAKINEWIESDEYQALIPLREEGSDIEMTSYQVLD